MDQHRQAETNNLDNMLLQPGTEEHILSTRMSLPERQFVKSHVLLLIVSGKGELEYNGQTYPMERGHAYLLAPGMFMELRTSANNPLNYYRISFDLWNPVMKAGGVNDTEALFCQARFADELYGKLQVQQSAEVLGRTEELCKIGVSGKGLDSISGEQSIPTPHRSSFSFRRQMLLFDLLNQLFLSQPTDTAENISRLERTMDYMHTHYPELITREKLAELADMSVWHYAHLFKTRTRHSPMEYLNGIRMNQAKERLLTGGGKVRDVARQVGFADEFYFSRKFKKTVGLSPTNYIKQKLEKIAAISFPYTGHLLALGITPYVALVDKRRDLHRLDYVEHIPYQLSRSKTMSFEKWRTNLDVLAVARPEIIICSEYEDAISQGCIRQLATTVVIAWNRLDWRSHFRQVALVVGKMREAELWLAAYEAKAERAGALLRSGLGEHTVSVLHIMLGELLVYGCRNAGAVLFEDLGLNPAYDVHDIQTYRNIGIEDLASYTGDRLLLIVDGDPASKHTWETLRELEQWTGLVAVREGHVYEQHEMPWLDYSPLAHNMIIDRVVTLFGGTGC